MNSSQPNRTPGWFLRALRSVLSATVGLAALVLLLAYLGGAFHQKVAPGSVPVQRPTATGRTLVPVELTRAPDTVTVVGSVQPRRKAEVASQILATIREIKPRPGDRVAANEVIVVLDDRELVAQQREAVAGLATAEADFVTRKSDFDRIKLLRNMGSISAEEANRIEGAFRVAETQVRRAKETINRIEVQLTYSKIAASTSGLVSDRFAEPGDLATPGKPLLVVYDPSDLELRVNVPESLASGITVGQHLDIRIDANNLSTSAIVREVVPEAQQSSRSVLVKLAVPQTTTNPILPGMYGRAVIPIGQLERIWLPQSAVQRVGQLDLVEVAGTDGTLSRRFVRVGRIVGDRIEILTGLSPGEQVALPNKSLS